MWCPELLVCRGGGAIKDVFLEQINVTNGGKNLVEDSELMLAFGRRYGLVGRNGTGARRDLHMHATCTLHARVCAHRRGD